MDKPTWDSLSKIEHDLMICAIEGWGILPYACDVDDSGRAVSDADVAAMVLELVDRGWVEIHRLVPWTSPTGAEGVTYGPAVLRADLDELLLDPASWAEPSGSWVGALTLSRQTSDAR